MKLIVVRHGQTDWNVKKLLQGGTDIPLNETGLAQARETARLLQETPIDRIIVSPLARARVTGEMIAEGRNVPFLTDERLRERGYGEFEGKPKNKEDYARLWAYSQNLTFLWAENVRDCFARVFDFLAEIRERYPQESILIATHAGVAKVIRCYLCGMMSDRELADYVPQNAAPQIYYIR